MVSIIIINYNTFELTTNCIESVIKFTNNCEYEIILVDNASTECDANIFLTKFPSVQLIKSKKNGGFAYGNNLGIEKSKGDFILLLNSDTYLVEDSIGKSISFLREHPEIGVLGCKMIYPNGSVQYTARLFRSISWELLDLLRFIQFLMPYSVSSRLMLGKYFKHNESIYCDWVNGAFFMFRKEISKKLPSANLDERFFMYGEDHLWCWQFSQLGFKNYFFADTQIVHINNASTSYSKRLNLLKVMYKHELEIVKERKGTGLYYLVFKAIYGCKEYSRIIIKKIYYRITGKFLS